MNLRLDRWCCLCSVKLSAFCAVVDGAFPYKHMSPLILTVAFEGRQSTGGGFFVLACKSAQHAGHGGRP